MVPGRPRAAVAVGVALAMAVAGCSPAGGTPFGSAGGIPLVSGGPPAAATSSPVPTGSAGASEEVPAMSSPPTTAEPSAGPFSLTSSDFRPEGAIPRALTCDGRDVSPALAWTGVPAGAAALVLVVTDPDARGFVHWVVLDLPGGDGELAGGLAPAAPAPQQGTNDFGRRGWGGPCPPSGTHHYRFTLTALSAPLAMAGHPTGAEVRIALDRAGSTVLGRATLTGTYARGG